MYQPTASAYFRSLQIQAFILFYFYTCYPQVAGQTFISRSVQNTFKFAFHNSRSRLILLRQISPRISTFKPPPGFNPIRPGGGGF